MKLDLGQLGVIDTLNLEEFVKNFRTEILVNENTGDTLNAIERHILVARLQKALADISKETSQDAQRQLLIVYTEGEVVDKRVNIDGHLVGINTSAKTTYPNWEKQTCLPPDYLPEDYPWLSNAQIIAWEETTRIYHDAAVRELESRMQLCIDQHPEQKKVTKVSTSVYVK